MFGLACLLPRSYLGRAYVPPAPAAVTTSRSVVHDPWGSILTLKVRPFLSSLTGADAEIVDANGQVGRLLVVVQDRELLVEAVTDGAPANHRQLGVDVHRACARDEEEARLEVLQVVDRE